MLTNLTDPGHWSSSSSAFGIKSDKLQSITQPSLSFLSLQELLPAGNKSALPSPFSNRRRIGSSTKYADVPLLVLDETEVNGFWICAVRQEGHFRSHRNRQYLSALPSDAEVGTLFRTTRHRHGFGSTRATRDSTCKQGQFVS